MDNFIQGHLKEVFDINYDNPSFPYRNFLLQVSGQYPQLILFRLTQSRIHLPDKHQIGDQLTVYFNVNGKEYRNKNGERAWFVSLVAWRLSTGATEAAKNAEAPQPLEPVIPIGERISEPGIGTAEDDLPF